MLGSKPLAGIDVSLILAITVPILSRAVRVIRSAALAVREMPYVEAARATG